MFNVLVESIKTSTEVQKQVAQSNYELVKNCNQMITSATRMLNVAVDKLAASGASNKAAGASGSKKAAGAQRGKRKVIVILDGEEKEVCVCLNKLLCYMNIKKHYNELDYFRFVHHHNHIVLYSNCFVMATC
jgi:hypothetical protein